MDFWIDVFSSWDAFLTFVFVLIVFFGGIWIISKVAAALAGLTSGNRHSRTKYDFFDPSKPPKMTDPIVTRVAGVTFAGRQPIVRRLQVAQALQLVQEPANPHDPNAVKVVTHSGDQVGYVPRELAQHIQWWFHVSMLPPLAKVLEVTGDEHRGQSLGVIIEIYPPSLEEAQLSSHMLYPPPP